MFYKNVIEKLHSFVNEMELSEDNLIIQRELIIRITEENRKLLREKELVKLFQNHKLKVGAKIKHRDSVHSILVIDEFEFGDFNIINAKCTALDKKSNRTLRKVDVTIFNLLKNFSVV